MQACTVLSRYVKGSNDCLASPITGLSERAKLGFTILPNDPESGKKRMIYGYVHGGNSGHEGEIRMNKSGILGGHVTLIREDATVTDISESAQPTTASI